MHSFNAFPCKSAIARGYFIANAFMFWVITERRLIVTLKQIILVCVKKCYIIILQLHSRAEK